METVKNKVGIIFSAVLLSAFIFITIFFICNGAFLTESIDFAIVNEKVEIINEKEINPAVVLCFVVLFIMAIYYLYRSLSWKLEYDDSSFSVAYENIDCIEYKKIVSVVHYKAYRYKSSIDEFIINYIGLPEFGYEEGVQKAIIKYCPHNNDMRCFFSFMKDKNPKIEFSSEKAGSDGIEKDDFDFFLDA